MKCFPLFLVLTLFQFQSSIAQMLIPGHHHFTSFSKQDLAGPESPMYVEVAALAPRINNQVIDSIVITNAASTLIVGLDYEDISDRYYGYFSKNFTNGSSDTLTYSFNPFGSILELNQRIFNGGGQMLEHSLVAHIYDGSNVIEKAYFIADLAFPDSSIDVHKLFYWGGGQLDSAAIQTLSGFPRSKSIYHYSNQLDSIVTTTGFIDLTSHFRYNASNQMMLDSMCFFQNGTTLETQVIEFFYDAQNRHDSSFEYTMNANGMLGNVISFLKVNYSSSGLYDSFLYSTINNGVALDLVEWNFKYRTSQFSLPEGSRFPLQLYPNPVGDFLFVGLEGLESDFKIHIFDMQGREIPCRSSRVLNAVSVDCAALKAGIYLVHLSSSGSRQWAKFLKE